MYATTLPRSNWLRRASIRLAWYRHMPASSCLLICYSTLVKLFNFFIIYFFLLCYHYMVNKDVYKAIKNWVATEGRSNPWGDVDQMSLVGRYAGRNHVCNIWWMSVNGCGCGERGKFAFSHCLMPRPYNIGTLQHWSHYRVTVCMIIRKVTATCFHILCVMPEKINYKNLWLTAVKAHMLLPHCNSYTPRKYLPQSAKN